MKTAVGIACFAVVLATTGCGGVSASPPSTTTGSTREAGDPTTVLSRAARDALRKNYQLSAYVLWHNAIPASAQQSTRGPALAALRSAAAQRRKSGIQIKPVDGHLTVLSVAIDPSFTKAIAITLAAGRVRPYEGGKAEPRTIKVHERARVELRRLDHSKKFVVWQVTVLR